MPVDIKFEGGVGNRTGRSSLFGLFGLVVWGDASVAAAARQGNIGVVHQIDAKVVNIALFRILPIWFEYETIVSGMAR